MTILKNTFALLLVSFYLVACGSGSSSKPESTNFKAGKVNVTSINSASRGRVNLEVYLPPKWKKEGETYPVIFFLHGAFGNEKGFFRNVKYQQLNDWINQGKLPPFVLIAIASHYVDGIEQQWSSAANETFLTSRANTELRAFSLKYFNAGDSSRDIRKTSIHGHSRGARGALHYGLKFSTLFTSAIADAFVSDYALEEEQQNALQYKNAIISSGIKIRLSVGDSDAFENHRKTSALMHGYLDSIGIAHQYEVLTDTNHTFHSLWNGITTNSEINGLYELKLHATTW